MPIIIGARELRSRAAEILRAVREGETVTITYRGRSIAEIKPLREPEETSGAVGDVFGMWSDRDDMKDVDAWVRAQRDQRAARSRSTRTS